MRDPPQTCRVVGRVSRPVRTAQESRPARRAHRAGATPFKYPIIVSLVLSVLLITGTIIAQRWRGGGYRGGWFDRQGVPEWQNDPDFKFVQWPDTHDRPASWHRDELSFAVSGDEGKTWSEPVVVARKPKGNVCYPYRFEIEPGKLWASASGGLWIELDVAKCVEK